jgi:Class II flagellar assembly regulator
MAHHRCAFMKLKCYMIKIGSPIDTHMKARPVRKRSASLDGAGAFSDLLDGISPSTEVNERATMASVERLGEVQNVACVNDLDVILSAQAVGNDFATRQRKIRTAHMTLDSLELLRFALLSGSVPSYLLQSIEDRMHELKYQESDPMLREILEEIELRAAVELAKLQNIL